MKFQSALMASVLVIFSAGNANAMTITFDNGTIQNSTSVSEVINSIDMVGILMVTAGFANGATETLTWGAFPDLCGPGCANIRGVTGSSGWSLYAGGGMSAAVWEYVQGSAPMITSLSLSGGNLAFDRGSSTPAGYTFSGIGTAGSSGGFGFQVDTTQAFGDGFADDPAGWAVTLANAVALNGAAPVGDLFKTLTINTGTGGFAGNFGFNMDVDSFVAAPTNPGGGGGTDPGPIPTPEPASAILLGSALLGLVAGRRRLSR